MRSARCLEDVLAVRPGKVGRSLTIQKRPPGRAAVGEILDKLREVHLDTH